MLQHRGFPRRQRPTEPSARSRSRLRERPVGASESAPEADDHPAPRADPPGASGQRDMPARVRPDVRVRVQGDCRRERAPRCGARQRRRHQALERESPQGAQPTGIPAGAEGTSILARNGRGRCGERPHARNGRSRATRRAAAASGACRYEPPDQPRSTLGDPFNRLVDSERTRSSRFSPDPASTTGTRRAAVVAGRRAAEGFQELALSRTHKSLFADGLRFVLDDDVHTVR
jgi:hypothetical protein